MTKFFADYRNTPVFPESIRGVDDVSELLTARYWKLESVKQALATTAMADRDTREALAGDGEADGMAKVIPLFTRRGFGTPEQPGGRRAA